MEEKLLKEKLFGTVLRCRRPAENQVPQLGQALAQVGAFGEDFLEGVFFDFEDFDRGIGADGGE